MPDDAAPPGYIDSRHFTSYVEKVKALKRAGRLSECKSLLLKILDANEAQARIPGGVLAPWWYEQLAIIYRKQKNYTAEVAVLERHAAQPGSFGLVLRFHKAKMLLRGSQGQISIGDSGACDRGEKKAE